MSYYIIPFIFLSGAVLPVILYFVKNIIRYHNNKLRSRLLLERSNDDLFKALNAEVEYLKDFIRYDGIYVGAVVVVLPDSKFDKKYGDSEISVYPSYENKVLGYIKLRANVINDNIDVTVEDYKTSQEFSVVRIAEIIVDKYIITKDFPKERIAIRIYDEKDERWVIYNRD